MGHRVPVLDLQRLPGGRDGLVREAGQAYREYGFCGFSGHGIPATVIDEAYSVFRQFFDLPGEAKMAYRSVAGGQRGYTPFGTERARDNAVPDLKEFFHIGREISGDNPWPETLMPNRWPREIPSFSENALALYAQLDRLGRRILGVIAESLGLDAGWFDSHVRNGNSILRAIHYPPIRNAEIPAVRAAQHEDINLITLLIGSSEAGLEILARDGSWVPVTGDADTIVVNIGDMMKRLSNHILPSTPHRVVNPRGEAASKARYSIPFFMHPDPGFIIETLPQCITPDNPDRYPEPVSADDFLLQRLRENYML
jgi:isopenicillin N synthase-like dioxygenase